MWGEKERDSERDSIAGSISYSHMPRMELKLG